MTILIDADSCPVIRIVEKVARRYSIPVTLLCDTNHMLTSNYSTIKVIGAGADAVDIALINLCQKGDIVITNDYGVAALALGKGARAIHNSGKWYTNDNINRLLMQRHLAKTARRKGNPQYKNPFSFGKKCKSSFVDSFEKMIRDSVPKTTLETLS